MPDDRRLVINWGCSKSPDWAATGNPCIVWNKTPNVRNASNKLLAFNLLRDGGMAEIPDYTTDYQTAVNWVNEGKVVLNRTQLNGHSGAGIVVAARQEDVVVGCPLYVLYRKKKSEFRVHVAFGQVIDVQQKLKRRDYDGDVDYAVRNHHTGWIYARGDVAASETRDSLAVRAVALLGLDFGAVDIIYNEHTNQYIVLEVNTAPGLEGLTVEKYVAAFTERVLGH